MRCSNTFAAKIHLPYMVMAGVLVVAGHLGGALLPAGNAVRTRQCGRGPDKAGTGLFHYPHLWLGVLCLFLYVGVEVMAGDAIGTYGRAFGLPLDQTKFFTVLHAGGDAAGLCVRLGAHPALRVARNAISPSPPCSACLLALGAFITQGYVSVGFVAALGFANAMMWPAIFPLAIRHLGRYTEFGSALLIMGIAGGAIIPQLFVHLKQLFDFQEVFLLLMAPCYLYILFYALVGNRMGLNRLKVSAVS